MRASFSVSCWLACSLFSGLVQAQAAPPASTALGNTLQGPSGTFRVEAADTGEIGSVRLSVLGSYFTGTGVLCPPCSNTAGVVSKSRDQLFVTAQRLQLSLTPVEFLEGFASVRFQQIYDDHGEPRVMQDSGDSWFGVKGAWPCTPGRFLCVGGSAALGLFSRTTGVGFAAAGAALQAVSTLDLTRLEHPLPLRAHLNVAYLFDNSHVIADDLERSRSRRTGEPARITRVERLGYQINRVDSVRLGLAAEATLPYVRPFAEWSFDLPVNSHDYVCHRHQLSAGDACLAQTSRFSMVPSRVTLGARAYLWFVPWAKGMAALVAFDIGTGGTKTFVEEVAPELPWQFHVGLSYAFDLRPPPLPPAAPPPQLVRIPPPPGLPVIEGEVVDGKDNAPLARATVLFKDTESQGMLADSTGHFRTAGLKPGSYVFQVEKEGYQPAECTAQIPLGAQEPSVARARCALVRLPVVATVDGIVRDADSTQYIEGASVSISDSRNRSLTLQTDAQGSFRFENVPPGTTRLKIEQDGYLPAASEVVLKPRDSVALHLTIHPRPRQSSVVVTKKELKLVKQIHFLHDSAEILPDSASLIEEIAEALRQRPALAVEIQGHTDNSGSPDHNQCLSEQRASAVRNALLLLGIEPARLVARGYGQGQPLAPNTTAAGRTRNRRVQLMILPAN